MISEEERKKRVEGERKGNMKLRKENGEDDLLGLVRHAPTQPGLWPPRHVAPDVRGECGRAS